VRKEREVEENVGEEREGKETDRCPFTQTPNAASLYSCYPRPLHVIEEMVARVFSSEGISGEREYLCAHYFS
jgi:hypothetical protein